MLAFSEGQVQLYREQVQKLFDLNSHLVGIKVLPVYLDSFIIVSDFELFLSRVSSAQIFQFKKIEVFDKKVLDFDVV